MSDLTDDQVKALLDGATPGPWRADGEPWNRVVWSSADNRVCFMAHSSGLNDARDIATSNLIAAAPDLARALLDARAELARVKADAAAAQALMVERAAEVCDDLAIGYAKHKGVPDALHDAARDIRALAPADGLAAVEALRVEARENAMQALASMGQAQEAYEAQLEAEAELARLRDRERVLADFIAEFAAAKIDALRYQPAYGESPEDAPDPVVEAETVWAWQEDARAALAPTIDDPGDGWTWNERLGWIGPDGKPADPRRRG